METSEFRNKLLTDVLGGQIPARVPDKISAYAAATLELAGYDLKFDQYGSSKVVDACEKISSKYDTDNLLGSMLSNVTTPNTDVFSQSRLFSLSDKGMIQHPEVSVMEEDVISEYSADPVTFIWEKAIPRLYPAFDKSKSESMANLHKTVRSQDIYVESLFSKTMPLAAKLNKVTISTSANYSRAPFDFFADTLRSFSKAMVDIRRHPDKVLEAVEASAPYMRFTAYYKIGEPSRLKYVALMLHMATYMRVKDFEKFWWPSFKELIWDVYDNGFNNLIFCEQDWTHLFDYLCDLPPLTYIMFEKGDLKTIKEKLGGKHVIQGYVKNQLIKFGTKDEVERGVKQVLDIMAPGGKFIMGLDNSIIMKDDINWDNMETLVRTAHEYGKY